MYILVVVKDFDRVNHWTLLKKSLERGLSTCLVRLLQNWFGKQMALVRWGNMFSDAFQVSNGVRRGGVTSPFLFQRERR